MTSTVTVEDCAGRSWKRHLVGEGRNWHAYGGRRRSDGLHDTVCTRRRRRTREVAKREFQALINLNARHAE